MNYHMLSQVLINEHPQNFPRFLGILALESVNKFKLKLIFKLEAERGHTFGILLRGVLGRLGYVVPRRAFPKRALVFSRPKIEGEANRQVTPWGSTRDGESIQANRKSSLI